MLDTWERVSVDEVIERVEREGGDARDPVAPPVRACRRDRGRMLQIDLAVRDWARRDPGSPTACGASTTGGWLTCARCSGSSVPTRRTSRSRCILAFSLLVGNHFIAADHGERSRADVMRLAIARLLS